jgi:hypothetical protein
VAARQQKTLPAFTSGGNQEGQRPSVFRCNLNPASKKERVKMNQICKRLITGLSILISLGVLATLLTSAPTSLAAPTAASPGDVVINEFTAKGTEWVELLNTSGDPVDLTGLEAD